MTAKKKKKRSFEQEKAYWYDKLKKEGFEDIENPTKDTLKTWSLKFTTPKSKATWKAKQSYYYMATHFLNDYKFDSEIEKTIWEYHSNGMSYDDIIKTLRKVNIRTYNRMNIYLIVKKLKEAMMFLYNNNEDAYHE